MKIREWWFKKEQIRAVHDDDLRVLLESLNILTDVLEGKRECEECKVTITLDNLGAIYPRGDAIILVCNNPCCLIKEEGVANELLA